MCSIIMVGGFAINMNGFTRATQDSDLWLKDNLGNKKAVNRPKDQIDVIELEKIKKYLDEKDTG